MSGTSNMWIMRNPVQGITICADLQLSVTSAAGAR